MFITAPVAGAGVGPAEQLGIVKQTWKMSPVHRPGRPNSAGFFC